MTLPTYVLLFAEAQIHPAALKFKRNSSAQNLANIYHV